MSKNTMCWTHIILEAYCGRKWSDKKDKYWHELTNTKKFKTKKVANPHYDPNYRMPRKPSYCPNVPQYICLEKNCPHLAYTNAVEKDYLFLNKKLLKNRFIKKKWQYINFICHRRYKKAGGKKCRK